METFLVWQSLIIALWVAAVMSRSFLGGATLTLRSSPLMTGLVVGAVMGNIAGAMIVTVAIQLIYLGVFSPGGTTPSEPSIATAVAVSVALLGNLKPEVAIAVAVPVGLLGAYLYQFRFFINTYIGKATDRAVAILDHGGITRSVIIYPTIASFLLFVPIVFITLYWGAPVIASMLVSLEGTIFIHILEVVGRGLAAIGIATTIFAIGRKEYIIFFLLAYFMSIVLKSLDVTMITYAIIGTLIAAIFILSKGSMQAKVTSTSPASTDGFDDEDDDF